MSARKKANCQRDMLRDEAIDAMHSDMETQSCYKEEARRGFDKPSLAPNLGQQHPIIERTMTAIVRPMLSFMSNAPDNGVRVIALFVIPLIVFLPLLSYSKEILQANTELIVMHSLVQISALFVVLLIVREPGKERGTRLKRINGRPQTMQSNERKNQRGGTP